MITIYTFKEFCEYIQTEDPRFLVFQEISPGIIRKDTKLRVPSFDEDKYIKQTAFLFTNEKFGISCQLDKSQFKGKIDFNKHLYLKYLDIIFKKLSERI